MPKRRKKEKKVESVRHYDCETYDRCLTYIAKLDKTFTCVYCKDYRKIVLYENQEDNSRESPVCNEEFVRNIVDLRFKGQMIEECLKQHEFT